MGAMEFEELKPEASTKAPPPMTQQQMQASFEPMQFAGSSIILPDGCYRVYTSPTEFTEVQAASAYEAMRKADVHNPYRIERFSLSRMAVLTQELLSKNVVLEDEVVIEQQPAASEANADTALPTEEDAATRGLEGDEVDALLDGKEE